MTLDKLQSATHTFVRAYLTLDRLRDDSTTPYGVMVTAVKGRKAAFAWLLEALRSYLKEVAPPGILLRVAEHNVEDPTVVIHAHADPDMPPAVHTAWKLPEDLFTFQGDAPLPAVEGAEPPYNQPGEASEWAVIL